MPLLRSAAPLSRLESEEPPPHPSGYTTAQRQTIRSIDSYLTGRDGRGLPTVEEVAAERASTPDPRNAALASDIRRLAQDVEQSLTEEAAGGSSTGAAKFALARLQGALRGSRGNGMGEPAPASIVPRTSVLDLLEHLHPDDVDSLRDRIGALSTHQEGRER